MVTLEVSRPEQIKANDWQFTELVMRTWSEPELAGSVDGIVIEDLDHAAPVSAFFSYCG
jgi:hypothetical protein